MNKKKLVVIRHAHRNVPEDRTEDNGLSTKGLRQVERLLSYWSDSIQEGRILFVSSPKRRCLETLAPLADIFEEPLAVDELLDEQKPKGESNREFEARVEKFLEDHKKGDADTIFLCSHADWIPAAYHKVKRKNVHVKKGDWVELEL